MLPARSTGLRFATGVIIPVLPTENSRLSSSVQTSSGGNLKAIAHFGTREVKPSSSCLDISSTLITTPSVA